MSAIRFSDNKNFYKKGLKEKEAYYPDINKQKEIDVQGVIIDLIDMTKSANINAIVEEANYKKNAVSCV